ncbi:cbb3-type cytochrome c oxidase subunit 3 [Loktanella agnita]|uniref:cbb3-type cytochrome c oxidase subunit 3 n=1 Tax=Loktanella agnita TaxID=287097 RepID=UPI0039867B55
MHDTYTLMRAFADSWALLILFAFFVGAFLWVWRPGSRPLHDDAARSIFRETAGPPRLTHLDCDKRRADTAKEGL